MAGHYQAITTRVSMAADHRTNQPASQQAPTMPPRIPSPNGKPIPTKPQTRYRGNMPDRGGGGIGDEVRIRYHHSLPKESINEPRLPATPNISIKEFDYGQDQEKADSISKASKESREGRAAKEVPSGLYERQASQNQAATNRGWYPCRSVH